MSTSNPPDLGLDAVFSPRAVAVIGASGKRESIGFSLLHNLILSEFHGAIYPVNPRSEVIHSHKVYRSVTEIPDPVDLAVVMVPVPAVEPVIAECLACGIRGLVVITAGFAETGEEGAAIEARLREMVRAGDARMIGPNCMGVINTADDVRLNATFAPVPARPGSIGFVSQSGALGVAVLNVAQDLGIGLTQFVSIGNKAEVTGNDMLEYWENDENTRVVCMYLESFGNPRKFTEIAKRVSRRKPILIVKSGRTTEGARAASSHTGAIAGADVTISAFLAQCGVLRANTIDDLFDVARALDRCPLPAGNRVAIVTNAGGPAIMATDACVNLGLEMAELPEVTRARLATFLPPQASLANPVDMIASATAEDYARALRAVLEADEVDMALVVNVTPQLTHPMDVLESIGEAVGDCSKPVLTVIMATEEFYNEARMRTDLPPVYRFPESAARGLAQLSRYAAWRRTPEEGETPRFAVDRPAVEALLASTREGYLPTADAFRLLELYGIPVARWRVARDPEEVLSAAEEIGYPLVLKAIVPDLVHKTEAGGVRVDLRQRTELEEALAEMRRDLARAGHSAEAYLLQEMGRHGHEVIFGISTDSRFGPVLMFGLGGKYVEVFRDVRFGVTPLTPGEARDMVHGIRGIELLEGVRGETGADLDLLAEILLRISQLSQDHPRIRELDINPFLAAGESTRAKAVDVRIRVDRA
jgi:acetyl coenzyme A synthetase (ADP forming)-like protein